MKAAATLLLTGLLATPAWAQWTSIGPGGESLSSVSFYDASNGWAGGANSVFYKTQDGGKTWQNIRNFYNQEPHHNILCVAATATGQVAIIEQLPSVSRPAVILYSTPTGYPASTNGIGDYTSLSMRQSAAGLAVGNAGTLALTTDQGASWTNLTSGTGNNLTAVDVPDNTVAYLVGSKGTARKAAGPAFTNWQALNTGTTVQLNSVWFVTARQGYVVGTDGTALRTTDGGASWTTMPVGTSVDLNAVRFLSARVGFIAGDLGTILLTTDGGVSWQPEASNTFETLTSLSATPDGAATWVSGGGGTVLKRGPVVVPLAAHTATPAPPTWQAYPNPFTHTLQLHLPASQTAQVRLLDITGHLVAEQRFAPSGSPTTYSLALSESLAVGLYVLQVALDGQAFQMQRLSCVQ